MEFFSLRRCPLASTIPDSPNCPTSERFMFDGAGMPGERIDPLERATPIKPSEDGFRKVTNTVMLSSAIDKVSAVSIGNDIPSATILLLHVGCCS